MALLVAVSLAVWAGLAAAAAAIDAPPRACIAPNSSTFCDSCGGYCCGCTSNQCGSCVSWGYLNDFQASGWMEEAAPACPNGTVRIGASTVSFGTCAAPIACNVSCLGATGGGGVNNVNNNGVLEGEPPSRGHQTLRLGQSLEYTGTDPIPCPDSLYFAGYDNTSHILAGCNFETPQPHAASPAISCGVSASTDLGWSEWFPCADLSLPPPPPPGPNPPAPEATCPSSANFTVTNLRLVASSTDCHADPDDFAAWCRVGCAMKGYLYSQRSHGQGENDCEAVLKPIDPTPQIGGLTCSCSGGAALGSSGIYFHGEGWSSVELSWAAPSPLASTTANGSFWFDDGSNNGGQCTVGFWVGPAPPPSGGPAKGSKADVALAVVGVGSGVFLVAIVFLSIRPKAPVAIDASGQGSVQGQWDTAPLLGDRANGVWRCSCGRENTAEARFCAVCGGLRQ